MRRRILRKRLRVERADKVCKRDDCSRPVHPNRDSDYCDAVCSTRAHEHEARLERARISARAWLYERHRGT